MTAREQQEAFQRYLESLPTLREFEEQMREIQRVAQEVSRREYERFVAAVKLLSS